MRHEYEPSFPSKNYNNSKSPTCKQPLVSILKHCKILNNEINRIESLEDERQFVNACSKLLREKYDDLVDSNRKLQSQVDAGRLEKAKNGDRVADLVESLNQYKMRESSLQLSSEGAQKQWETTNEILAKTREKLDELDDKLFAKSKECSNAIQENKSLKGNIQILSKELKETIINNKERQKKKEQTIENYRLQQFEIFKILEIKEEEIQQLVMKNSFTQQEYDIIEKQYLRWKERYDLQAQAYKNMQQQRQQTNSLHLFNFQRQSPRPETRSEQKQLYEQIHELKQKFRKATDEKQRLYAELDQIKQILLVHGIQYDKIEDAPLIQIIRQQKQSSRRYTPQYRYFEQY